MTIHDSPKLHVYGLVMAVALGLGVLTARPELMAFGAPFLLFVVWSLATRETPHVAGTAEATRARLLEQETTELRVRLATRSAARVDVALHAPVGITLDPPARALSVRADRAGTDLPLRADRWGAHLLGPLTVRAWDPFGTRAVEESLGGQLRVRVYPRPWRVRSLLTPRATLALTGSRRSAERGEGIEYADVALFGAGDRVRSINWRASARRGELHVTRRHPERNAEVVLLLDAFAEPELDDVVRVAAALARPHLHARDRVAVVGVGTGVWWLEGALGQRQLYRIIDALIESQSAISFAWRDTSQINRRVLPSGALVVAVSPLLLRRSAQVLLELRGRGHDVAVVEIAPRLGDPPRGRDPDAALGQRIWALTRELQRSRLRARGIAVAPLANPASLDRVVEEVNAWRAAAQRRSA